MKTRVKKLLGLFIVIIVLGFTVFKTLQEDQLIVGTWVEVNSSFESRWVFYENGICEDYAENKIFETYNWTIETTSPQCGQEVKTGGLFSYLKLVNVDDNSDVYCYEITNLGEEYLALWYLPSSASGITLFKRLEE